VLADHHYRRGEWDEALKLADEYLGAVEAGSPHYNAYQDWVIRAQMRVARGDLAGAMRDAESGLAAGRALADPQAVYFVLPACANIFYLAGEHDRAVPLVRELIEAVESGLDVQFAVVNFPVFAAAARHLGLEQEVLAALADYAATPWTEAVRAYGQRDFAAAAEILRRIGTRPDEAEARLRAAEELAAQGRRAEADEQLQQALAFYRSVGATRYVRECEALLPASA
jgi:tetratricopeptide (TPR) repeat protein